MENRQNRFYSLDDYFCFYFNLRNCNRNYHRNDSFFSCGFIQSFSSHMAKLAHVPNTNFYRNTRRFKELKENNDELFIRIDGQIYFANISFIQKQVEAWDKEKANALKKVVLNFESVISIDSTGAHEIEDWINNWHKKGISVAIAGARGPVRDILVKWNLIEKLGEDYIFINMHDAVQYLNKTEEANLIENRKYALQSNVN